MGSAETAPGMLLVYDRCFVAAGTYRGAGQFFFSTHASPPVGDPDDPDLVIRKNERVLRYKGAVSHYDHLKGVDPQIGEDPFNGCRVLVDNPYLLVGQDNFHALIIRLGSTSLKHPGAVYTCWAEDGCLPYVRVDRRYRIVDEKER
jgi:hypothetical protein